MKIAILVGSLRKESYNKKLATALVEMLPARVSAEYIELGDVPFMNEDLEATVPAPVVRVAAQVQSADAVLIFSPEYNRGVPAVTKNIIDWLSRPSTGAPLAGKSVAIAGATSGPIRTLVMQSQLRGVLAHVGAHVMDSPALGVSYPAMADEDGALHDATAQFVERFVLAFVAHVELYSGEV